MRITGAHRSSARARLRGGLLAAALVCGTLVACATEERDTLLQGKDFETIEGVEARFDRNDVLDLATFSDVESLDAALIQKFLARTPYGRPSFLETYQSNGVRAADAVLRAARTYRINPLVFLVFAQTEGGLMGVRSYPLPPERVEYVFRCGCMGPGVCVPELAGFDRQVDCLGKQLRTAVDAVAANGATAGGWGPDRTSTTLDGVKVSPANEATAALYERIPAVRVNEDKGMWVFWNIWTLYATELDYGGPIGVGSAGHAIGDPCTTDGSCGADGTCATNYPGGYCTRSCTGDCAASAEGRESFCAAFPDGGYCLAVCNPGAPACREGYRCLNVRRFNATDDRDARHVCTLDAPP